MARPLVEGEIGNTKLNAILDTGAWRSYIREERAKDFPSAPTNRFEVKLGRNIFTIREGRLITGIVKDTENRVYLFSHVLYPVTDLGKEKRKRIDILYYEIKSRN